MIVLAITVLFYAMLALGIGLAVLMYTMLSRIKLRLPADEQLQWNQRSSAEKICSLYDRHYPNTHLTIVFRLARNAILILGLVIVILISMQR